MNHPRGYGLHDGIWTCVQNLMRNNVLRTALLLALGGVCVLGLVLLSGAEQFLWAKSQFYEDQDGYAVLSVLLSRKHGPGNAQMDIVSDIHGGAVSPFSIDYCGRQVPDEFQAAALDFFEENRKPLRLTKNFTVNFEYRLLKNSQKEHSVKDPLYAVSAVGFDPTRTYAFVAISADCGFNCFGGGYYLARRNGKTWEEVKQSPICETMAYKMGTDVRSGL